MYRVISAKKISHILPFFLISLSTVCHADSLFFQGFETDNSEVFTYNPYAGDGNGYINRTPSGGGSLGLTAAMGNYYAEIHNDTNSYQPGYGTGFYTDFGYDAAPGAYPGSPFSQSVDVYIDVTTPSASGGEAGYWIDMIPGSTDPNDAANGGNGYGDEHNFRMFYNGTSVGVEADGDPGYFATITTSGWYTFEATYAPGPTATSLVTTDLFVYNSTGTLVGAMPVLADSDGETLESQYLGGPDFGSILVWQDGFSNDLLGIDDVRADDVGTATPEPASFALLGLGLFVTCFAGKLRTKLSRFMQGG